MVRSDLEIYFAIVSICFIITGIAMGLLLWLSGADWYIVFNYVEVMSNPIHYLIVGLLCFCFYFAARKGVLKSYA